MPTATSPTDSETRAPKTRRAQTSLPMASVPRMCSALGGLFFNFRSMVAGSVPASRGAKIAAITRSTSMTRPTIPSLCRNNRRQNRCCTESLRGASSVSESSEAVIAQSLRK